MRDAERLTDAPATLGEGPCWDAREGALYWVDILGRALHRFRPGEGDAVVLELPERIGTVAPRARGGLVLALENGLAFFDPAAGTLERLPEIEPGTATRFNDGKCDPFGRFWAGTMDLEERAPLGTLYRFEAGGAAHAAVSGVTVSNGMAWSPGRDTMFYIDSPTREVRAYPFDAGSGELGAPRVAVRFGEDDGYPDGMTTDGHGMLWVAHWGGGGVSRWDPESGRRLAFVEVPAPLATACCFGGPALEDLYITTARVGLGLEDLERFPWSGCLFRARPGVAGTPTYAFAG